MVRSNIDHIHILSNAHQQHSTWEFPIPTISTGSMTACSSKNSFCAFFGKALQSAIMLIESSRELMHKSWTPWSVCVLDTKYFKWKNKNGVMIRFFKKLYCNHTSKLQFFYNYPWIMSWKKKTSWPNGSNSLFLRS